MTGGGTLTSGFPRTAREWLLALNLELPDPTPEDMEAFHQVMDHDEFWE